MTYYVDTAGYDSQDGQSPASAWRTLSRITQAALKPGDSVLLKRDCVWLERLTVPASGLPGHPITFGAYGIGENPIIRGLVVRDCIFVWDKHDVAFCDLHLIGGVYGIRLGGACANVVCIRTLSSDNQYDGFMVDGVGCSGITFENCVSYSNRRHGLLVNGGSGVTVRAGWFYSNTARYGAGIAFSHAVGGLVENVIADGNYYGVKVANQASGITVRGCRAIDNGILLDGERKGFGIDVDIGAFNITVEGCEVSASGKHGIVVECESHDCTVRGNTCYQNGAGCAGVFVEEAYNVSVLSNTIHDEAKGVWFYGGAHDCSVMGNTVTNCGALVLIDASCLRIATEAPPAPAPAPRKKRGAR